MLVHVKYLIKVENRKGKTKYGPILRYAQFTPQNLVFSMNKTNYILNNDIETKS